MRDQIYIVDDHPIVRKGITSLIADDGDLAVCGETGSAGEARRQLPELSPDLLLTEVALPDESGLVLIRDVVTHMELSVLAISTQPESLYARRVLATGGHGYLLKKESCRKIVDALHHVLAGNIYLSDEMSSAFLRATTTETPVSTDSPLALLSDRELEVFRLMGEGMGREEMANRLSLSPKTIDTYQEHLKTKLTLDTNEELRRDAALWVGTNQLSE